MSADHIPAFPTSHEEPADFNGHNGGKKIVIDQGMTLRDYFAAKAMQGFAAAALEFPTIRDMAACSYGWADAMMEARK